MYRRFVSITTSLLLSLVILLSGCGEDEQEPPVSIKLPISLSPALSQGDYSAKIAITGPGMYPIIETRNLAIRSRSGQTYNIVVDNIPVGYNRNVKVEISKDGRIFFEGSETTHLSGSGNNVSIMLKRKATDTKIAFASERDDNMDIYVMDTYGMKEERLTQAAANDSHPSWSPDRTKIAFTSSRKDNTDIYVMNANGTEEKRLTQAAADDLYPSWSPDGTKIAFMSKRDGNYEIYVMNANGTNQERLPGHGLYPSWSPFPW